MLKGKHLGREREQTRLRERMARAARAKGGSAKLIEGGPGLGKTRMLTELLLEGQLMGLMALRVDANRHRGPAGLLHALFLAASQVSPMGAAATRMATISDEPGPAAGETRQKAPRPSPAAPAPLHLSREQSERCVRRAAALQQRLLDLSEHRPLMLLVDDLHLADHESVSFVAGLARQAHAHRILLLATVNPVETPVASGPLEALRKVCDRYRLRPLTQQKTADLVASLFDKGAHAALLAEQLHQKTGGNPLLCMELSRSLVDAKVLRYVDGWWTLSPESSGWDIDRALGQQLAQMTPAARSLAEEFSLCLGPLSLELCRDLASAEDLPALFSAMDDLVACGVLISCGDGYVLGHRLLRQHLVAKLPKERLGEVHNRVGDALLHAGDQTSEAALQAGRHWIEGGDVARAESAILTAADDFLGLGNGLQAAIEPLLRLLTLCQDGGADDSECLPVLFALTLAGYSMEPDLAERFAARTFDALLKTTPVADKAFQRTWRYTPRFMDDGRRALLCSAFIFAKTSAQHQDTRSIERVVRELSRVFGAQQRAATATGGSGGAAPLSNLIIRCAQGFCDQQAGRIAEAYQVFGGLLTELRAEPGVPGLDAASARALQTETMFAQGLLACWREDNAALAHAEQLEAQGSHLARSAAAALRMANHHCRGETEQSDNYREHVEVVATQANSLQLVDRPLLAHALTTAALLRDLQRIKELIGWLQPDAEKQPNVAALCRCLDGICFAGSGESQKALDCFEHTPEMQRPYAHALWPTCAGHYAEVLNQIDDFEEAQRVCTKVLEHVSEDNRAFSLCYLEAQLQLAVAEAGLGQTSSAVARLDGLVDRARKAQHPLMWSAVHAIRAEMAIRNRSAADFAENFDALWELARATGNQAILGRASRLRQDAVQAGLMAQSASWGSGAEATETQAKTK